jgi:hypothetical protein
VKQFTLEDMKRAFEAGFNNGYCSGLGRTYQDMSFAPEQIEVAWQETLNDLGVQ